MKGYLYLLSILCPIVAYTLPVGEQVVNGSAVFSEEMGGSMEIQASDKAIINYDSFNIGKEEKVRFVQPGSDSCVLNRVMGKDPSSILGSLESNGKVFLVNPNGIYFGKEGSVNVGSLVASTLDILDQDFLNDTYQFNLYGSKKSFIENLGTINAPEGAVVLLAPRIKNEGVINAQAGKVVFASAESVTLDFSGDNLLSFILEGDLEEAVIEHLGTVDADSVFMNLKVAQRAIREVVNTEGVVEGNQIVKENGKIGRAHV